MENARGEELVDSTPMAIPVGFNRPPNLQDTIRRLVKTEMSQIAASVGRETFDEADDFDCDDDDELKSPYEITADQEDALARARDLAVANGNNRPAGAVGTVVADKPTEVEKSKTDAENKSGDSTDPGFTGAVK